MKLQRFICLRFYIRKQQNYHDVLYYFIYYIYFQFISILFITNPILSYRLQYQSMINFTQLFTCSQTQIYQKLPNQKKYRTTNKLSVLIDSQGDILFIIGQLCYGITKQTQVRYFLYQNNNAKFMIVDLQNHLHGNYQLLVKQNYQLLLACLAEKCNVVGMQKQVNKQQIVTPKQPKKIEQPKKIQQPKKKQQQYDIQQKKSQIFQVGLPLNPNDGKIVQVSKSLGQGMYMIGKYLSKGISAVGGFVANNLQSSDQIKFSQNTKQGLKTVNDITGQVFQFASGSVKKLINYGREVALNSVDSEEKNNSGTYLKNGAVTGAKVIINLYDGFVEGTDEVKNGAFQAGGKILRKKYGIQAEQVLTHVAGGVDNVVNIYKLPKNSVKYLFKVEKQQKN